MGSLYNGRGWGEGEGGDCGVGERGERGVVAGIDEELGCRRIGDREAHDSGVFDRECPTAWVKSSLRHFSSSSVTDHKPGLLGGGSRSARKAAPIESWTPSPCTAEAWIANGYLADGGGRSTASVGSMIPSNRSG